MSREETPPARGAPPAAEPETARQADAVAPRGPSHLGARVVLLVALLVVLSSWSQRHLGTAIPGLLLVALGLLKKFYDFVGGAEKAAHERRLRAIALSLLGDGFLSGLFLLCLLACAFVSSVTVMSAGTPLRARVRLAPEGRPLGEGHRTLEGPSAVTRILCLTTPLGRPFYLEVDGFQRHSFDLYPWSGAVVRVGQDLRRSPAVLLRVPMNFVPLLGVCAVDLIVGESDSVRVATTAERGALALGREVFAPADLIAEWRSELKAAQIPDAASELLVRRWREPLRVGGLPALVPGSVVRAYLVNPDGERIAAARLVVTDEEIQDVLLSAGGGP